MHIHAPSEHTFNGEHYDVELHLVHRNFEDNSLAVAAIFFDEKEGGNIENAFIDSLELDEEDPVVEEIPLHHLLRIVKTDEFYHYEGSLTSPPCTEGVQWIVFHEPLYISEEQVAIINNHFEDDFNFAGGNGNNRIT